VNNTPIEWCDFTVNPFRFRNLETGKVGHYCEKISEGCKNCYASTMQTGPYLSGLAYIASNKPKGELFLDEKVLQQVLQRKKPATIFWCDMTDMFLEDYPDEWIDRCFAVMALTPHLTHQVLTKRAKRMREWASRTVMGARIHTAIGKVRGTGWGNGPEPQFPLHNVWLGVSVEDQQRADERIPDLLQTPAAVRFLSCEPLLGPVDLTRIEFRRATWYDALEDHDGFGLLAAAHQKLSWVIVGGESGPGARPCSTEWVRSIVRQCQSSGTKCFVKQLGAHVIQGGERRIKADKKGGDMHEWEHDLRVRQMPEVHA
jgi:protein gp37